MSTTGVSREIYIYWRDLVVETSSPGIDLELQQSIWDCNKRLLDVAVKAAYPSELHHALYSEDEYLKMYHMQRLWYRYMDLHAGRTHVLSDCIEFTNDSNIHELDISIESVKMLHQNNVKFLFQIPDKLYNLNYEAALDITAALSLFKKRRSL